MGGISYDVRGSYFESCNCEAICPCRTIDGVRGGRSTYGLCFGVLSWRIDDGRVGDVDVGGLSAALTYRYDDDKPGSPWDFVIHVDARGDESQRAALADLFAGRGEGGHLAALPWIRKAAHLLDVRVSAIEIDDDSDGHRLRIGDAIAVRAASPVETDASVACIVPGYERPGTELYADTHVVADAPFAWELTGTCAFASDFDYASA